MQLTRGAEYAIRAVLDLTANYTGSKTGKMQLKEIAAHTDIPCDFLAKIFYALGRSGIVKSFRGAKGGYTLAKDPREINIKDVIYAIDGPMKLNKCLSSEGCVDEINCRYQCKCPIHDIWKEAQDSILKILGAADFRFLNEKMKNK